MKRWMALALVLFLPVLGWSQSLAEVAKKERERREKNKKRGIQTLEVAEREVSRPRTPPAQSVSAPGDRSDGVASAPDPKTAIESILGNRSLEPATPKAAPTPPPAPPPIAPAPPFSLQDRNGRDVSLHDFHGRPVLIDFWATWCGPCRSTMPEVQRLHRKYGDRGLQVLGINIEGKTQGVLDYLDETGYSFVVLFDSGNWKSGVAQLYQVSSIPRTFLIDKNGSIVYSGHPDRLSESMIEATLQ